MSHNCFVYLDDGISGSRDYISASAASNIQRSDLASEGFVTNEEKSNWEPVQIGEWLGFLINTIRLTFQIPPKKLEKLRSSLELLVNDGHSTYRSLARLAGFITSLSLAVGPRARIFTRQMHYAIHARPSWDGTFVFNDPLMQELKFWLQKIRAFEGFPLKATFCADSVLFTDASEFAFGGYVATLDGVPASGVFPESDLHTSSTFRELKAVLYVLQSYAEKLANQSVKIFIDNQGASRILTIGSPKPHLREVLLEVFKLCFRFGISIEAQWLPREENLRADLLSRFIDKDDWRLNPRVFSMIDMKWGPHSIDRFSSHLNNQVPKFNSKFFSPGCFGVDALAQNWSTDNNWLCPPVHLTPASLRKLASHKAVGTLVVPEWPSASFWPLLHSTPGRFGPFILDVFVLPRISDLPIPGPGQKEYYRQRDSVFSGCPSFSILALRVDFT